MRRILVLAVLVVALTLFAAPAGAITFGQFDGNRHPNVGAILADYDADSPGLELLGTGTLIAPRVVQTAGHCTDFLESIDVPRNEIWVSFAPSFDEDRATPTGFRGVYTTHPDFGFSGPGGFSNPFDLAVVVLNEAPGITPAELPSVGLLDRLRASGEIFERRWTAVGYGTVRETKTGGPNAFFFDGIRRYVTQGYLSIQSAWLLLSMNPSTGSGGTCFGDSGGPHFLGGIQSNLLVSLTVTGDSACRATDKTYRLDTSWVRDFLERFPGVNYPN